MTPLRQRMPLEGMRRRAWIATTARPARSTAPERSVGVVFVMREL
jgi:hypothetical protein